MDTYRLRQYFGNSGLLMWIIAINIAVWLLGCIAEGVLSLSGMGSVAPLEFLAVPSSPMMFLRRPWTLLTYVVTQQSFLHMLFNMLWMLWFGRIFLFSSSERGLFFTYAGGGIAGGAAYLLVSGLFPSGAGYLTGASAAVLSVMTAAAVMAPDMRLNLMLIGTVRLKWLALVCILLTFFGIGGGGSIAGQAAHAGGVLFGLLRPLFLRRHATITFPKRFYNLKERFFRRKPVIRKSPINPTDAAKAMEGRLCDSERLDQLLDKVRISGYDSLSATEKRELNAISRRL